MKFFRVNFKENKKLALRERVFALPTVHFYTSSIGRINSFTISAKTPAGVGKQLAHEVDRYLGASGHLDFLKSLKGAGAHPAAALDTYKSLVAVVSALKNAPELLAEAASKDAAAVDAKREVLDSEPGRVADLGALFEWIDANGDGVVDADELAAVAAAVAPMTGEAGCEEDFVWRGLLDQAIAALTDGGGGGSGPPPPTTLDKEAFVRLMTTKQILELTTPKAEVLPSFAALDKNDDGVISREEFLEGMERVCTYLPKLVGDVSSCREWSSEMAVAFEALDRNKSGSLDYEEVVAMLSGTRQLPKA